jgi:hypothetical protein
MKTQKLLKLLLVVSLVILAACGGGETNQNKEGSTSPKNAVHIYNITTQGRDYRSTLQVFCLDGYVFMFGGSHNGALIQMFEEADCGNGTRCSLPKKCVAQ